MNALFLMQIVIPNMQSNRHCSKNVLCFYPRNHDILLTRFSTDRHITYIKYYITNVWVIFIKVYLFIISVYFLHFFHELQISYLCFRF